jgi:mono/diheme cytochrome c family protein
MRNPLRVAVRRFVVASSLIVAAGPISAQEPAESSGVNPSFSLDDPARIKTGKRRFVVNCAGYCHGSDGTAGRGPSFRNRPDFDPAVAFVTIRDGRKGSDVMPPWGASFSPDEIWELVAFLQDLSKKD